LAGSKTGIPFTSAQDSSPRNSVAVSLETTGLNPLQDRITEVGAVRFDQEGTLFDTFWERANPGIPIPEHIRKITGITDEKVAEPIAECGFRNAE